MSSNLQGGTWLEINVFNIMYVEHFLFQSTNRESANKGGYNVCELVKQSGMANTKENLQGIKLQTRF